MRGTKNKLIALLLCIVVFSLGLFVGFKINKTTDKDADVDASIGVNKLKDKVIVNLGDSLFGAFRDDSSISAQLNSISGAKVHNIGFGGGRMSKRGDTHPTDIAWSAFSMFAVADSIASGDFSYQEKHLKYGTVSTNTIPGYFTDAVNELKGIDFNKVDVITIAYGTNDYTAGTKIKGEPFDTLTYLGSLEHSVKKIHEKYPNIKIVVFAPVWRYFEDGSDGCTKNYAGGGVLKDYVNALSQKCKEINVPFFNSYNDVKLEMVVDFEPNDRTHINASGRKKYAEYINEKLNELY